MNGPISPFQSDAEYKDDDEATAPCQEANGEDELQEENTEEHPDILENADTTTDQIAPQEDIVEGDMLEDQDVTDSPPREKTATLISSCNTRNSTPGSTAPVTDDGETVTVCCPCDVNEDDGLMILCAHCNTWQHALCFGVLDAAEAPESHICAQCSKSVKDPDISPTDPYLVNLDADELKEICLWRRTLLAVCETARVLAPSLAKRLGVETNYATHLVKRLETEGYLKSNNKSKRLGKLVLKKKIEVEGFTKYFRQGLKEIDETIDISEKSIEAIVNKASGMTLEEETSKNSEVTSKRRASKRAVSAVNSENEFEISDSQEVQCRGSKGKKRKTSVAAKSILV